MIYFKLNHTTGELIMLKKLFALLNEEKYAEIYLECFNPKILEEDVDYHEALQWIEQNITGTLTCVLRETVTNSRGIRYSAPIVQTHIKYRKRRELKKAIETIKARYNRKKLPVIFR